MSTQPFEMERTYDAPVERVWKAITDVNQMKQWYFDVPMFKAEVGSEFEFSGGPDDRSYRHLCVVKEVIPNKKLSYSWRYDGYEGESLVTFELFPEGGDRTRVKLTHSGLETFPASNPDLARKNFEAGWNDIIGEHLRKFVTMQHLNRDFALDADVETVWDILTNLEKVKQWASAFGENVYAESDWKKGSEVHWMMGSELCIRGIVEENDPQKVLRVRFFDNTETTDPAQLGEYVEDFRLSESDGKTHLEITTGPLPVKDIEMMSPMWDKAEENLRKMTEK